MNSIFLLLISFSLLAISASAAGTSSKFWPFDNGFFGLFKSKKPESDKDKVAYQIFNSIFNTVHNSTHLKVKFSL